MTVSKISDIDKATLLAYCMYNADQLNSVEENLNFTSSARILAVWPRLVSSREDAEKLVGKPSDLANVIYGPNSAIGKSLGNQYPEDGWKYRGRGYLQTTGRENYSRSSRLIGTDLVTQPDALAGEEIAAKEAVARFVQLADRSLINTFRTFTGGITGLAEAQKVFQILIPEASPSAVRPGDYKVKVQFAGTLQRDEVRNMMKTLRAAGWGVEGVEGGGERTGAAATYDEIRYGDNGDTVASQALAKAVQSTGIVARQIVTKFNAAIMSGTLEVCVSK